MRAPGITILGLGPGDPGLVTRQVWQFISRCSEIYFRTGKHPVVAELPPGIQLHTFDYLYESAKIHEDISAEIGTKILALGKRPEGVVYAVPGHPYVADATVPDIVCRAKADNLQVILFDGLSFLEPTFTALGIDPFPQTSLVDALQLADAHMPPFPPDKPAIVAQINSSSIASGLKRTLMAVYPDGHPVQLVHAMGTTQQVVENLTIKEIDNSPYIGMMTVLYIPSLGPATSFEAFQDLLAHLRGPQGCPWDQKQTHQSLRSSVLEETYEVLAALDSGDIDSLREELGDLLLLIVFHVQIATDAGEFGMAEVLHGIHSKIIYRHPHVFDDLKLSDADDVIRNWERLKAGERVANGQSQASILDGVSQILPALVRAQQYQLRAARNGFEWPTIQGVLDKLQEELAELKAAPDDAARSLETGDLLFSVVNLARWLNVDAESALREANDRFRRRFAHIEQEAQRQGKLLSGMSLDEMEALWQEAKGIV